MDIDIKLVFFIHSFFASFLLDNSFSARVSVSIAVFLFLDLYLLLIGVAEP